MEKTVRVTHAEREVFEQLEKSYRAVSELACIRQADKMSNSRIQSIAKELRDLIKVFTAYSI